MSAPNKIFNVKYFQCILFALFTMYVVILMHYKFNVDKWPVLQKANVLSSEAELQLQNASLLHQRALQIKSGKSWLLEDVLLSKQQPVADKSMFFIETSWNRLHQARAFSLNGRQACSIESAALHNDNTQIFVLFVNPVQIDESNAIFRTLNSYPNIHFRSLNIERFVKGTRAESWYANDNLSKTLNPIEHTADFLRFLVLWRWGGTYLDMDVIVQKSLEHLPPNYTGAQANTEMAVGVFNFEATGFGHNIAEQCIDEFMNNFNGYAWDNGPRVFDAVLRRLCNGASTVQQMSLERCQGFTVYEPNVFYPIYYPEWEKYFLESEYDAAMERLQASYAAHVWNKLSKAFSYQPKLKSAYATLADENCPSIFALLKGQF